MSKIETGQDAVEGAAEIGKAGFPTADLFYLAFSLQGRRVCLRAVRLRTWWVIGRPWFASELSDFAWVGKAHISIDSRGLSV